MNTAISTIDFYVEADTFGRVDIELAKHLPDYARAAVKKLFNERLVQVNDVAVKAGHKIRPGDHVVADASPLTDPAPAIELPILYEDDDVIVINKPEGVLTHANSAYRQEGSVASFARSHANSSLEGDRAGIVHRLDRLTSGVIICAKNPVAMAYLQKQFSQRTVKKSYVAVVAGSPEYKTALIDAPIGRNPANPKTFFVDQSGKSATTKYEVISETTETSTLLLQPTTGRTHQLRVHLEYIGHPIVGDTLYGGEIADRMMLHAYKLEITLPGGIRKVFTAPVPSSFGFESTEQ